MVLKFSCLKEVRSTENRLFLSALLTTNDANALPATCHSQGNLWGGVECFHISANYSCPYVMTGAESEYPVGASFYQRRCRIAFLILRVGRIREHILYVQTKKERKHPVFKL